MQGLAKCLKWIGTKSRSRRQLHYIDNRVGNKATTRTSEYIKGTMAGLSPLSQNFVCVIITQVVISVTGILVFGLGNG